MPWVNRRTGQVIQGTQQQRPQQRPVSQPSFTGGRLVQRPQQPQQQASGGGISPFSFARQGLNLGSRLLPKSLNLGGSQVPTGAMLGALGSLGGLGLAIANKSPGGILGSGASLAGFSAPIAQSLGLGTVGSTFGGSLSAAGSALANTLTGGAVGTAGPIIGAGAGATGTGLAGGLGAVGNLAIPFGALGLASMLTGGFKAGSGKKDIKEDVAALQRTMKIVQQARISGQPIRTEDIGGYLTAQRVNQQNQPFGGYGERAIEIAGTMVANALNAGTNIQPQNGRYVVPMILDKLTYQAGGRGDPLFGATPSGQPEPFSVSIPASEVVQSRSGRWTTESIKERREAHAQKRQDKRQGERSDD